MPGSSPETQKINLDTPPTPPTQTPPKQPSDQPTQARPARNPHKQSSEWVKKRYEVAGTTFVITNDGFIYIIPPAGRIAKVNEIVGKLGTSRTAFGKPPVLNQFIILNQSIIKIIKDSTTKLGLLGCDCQDFKTAIYSIQAAITSDSSEQLSSHVNHLGEKPFFPSIKSSLSTDLKLPSTLITLFDSHGCAILFFYFFHSGRSLSRSSAIRANNGY